MHPKSLRKRKRIGQQRGEGKIEEEDWGRQTSLLRAQHIADFIVNAISRLFIWKCRVGPGSIAKEYSKDRRSLRVRKYATTVGPSKKGDPTSDDHVIRRDVVDDIAGQTILLIRRSPSF